MQTRTLAFIGGGNMARSLIGGLLSDGYDPQRLCAADPNPEQRERLAQQFAICTSADNSSAIQDADVVILAVKPQVVHEVLQPIADTLRARRPLIVSIVAGVREPDLRRWLGAELPIVRTMPNTPALVRSGAAALYANQWVSAEQRELAESILRAGGLTVWVEQETQLDAVTALSGSGPAYFFLMMEAMEQAGVSLGLEAKTARLLTLQTAFGAAKMALESECSPAELRTQVTSPGGTTERALNSLRQDQFEAVLARALHAAAARAIELGELLGKH